MKRLAIVVCVLFGSIGLLMSQAANDVRWHRNTHAFDPNIILTLLKGTTPPAAECDNPAEAGRMFYDTDAPSGQRFFICQAEGPTWVLQGDGGSGGGGGSFSTIGTATADSGTDTLAVNDSLSIDFTTANDPESITADFLYSATLAGNPALGPEQCVFSTDGTGGGLLCEGSISNTIEGLLVWNPSSSDKTLTLPNETGNLVTEGQLVNGTVIPAITQSLAADPNDCAGGQFAHTIDEFGNLTCSTPGAGVYLPLAGGTMTGTITTENSGPTILIPAAQDANTIGPSIEFTAQGFETAPWRNFMAEGGAGDHDHVLAWSYNGEYTRNLGLVRDNNASHVINWAMESRFTLGDPNTVRGRFEMNLDIDPNVGHSSISVVRPYALHYNMDVGSRKTELSVGVPTDTGSPFFTMNGGFNFWSIADKVTFGERNDAGGLTNDPNSQGRIILDPGSVTSGTDRAVVIQNVSDGILNLMPGLNTSGGTAPIMLGFSRPGPVIIGGDGSETARFTVKGGSDVVQVHFKGHSTQNGEILLVEESDGTDLIRVFNQGIYQANFREDSSEPTCSSGIYGLSANPTPATMRVCNNGVRGDIPSSLAGSATLNFSDPAANACSSDLTITVTGAADGDVVSLGVPNGSVVADGQYTAWVSGANTVTVRHCCVGTTNCADPASGTFKARVDKP